jgi:hypothetical protein
MATKKLSPNMEKVLLAADADGWIRKSDAPTNTSVALIDRGFISTEVTKDREALYPVYGHWLTLAGKAAKAAIEQRNASKRPRGRTDAWRRYYVNHPEVVASWGEQNGREPDCECVACRGITAGDLIEIRQPGKRKWAMRVERLNLAGDLVGKQIRMLDGKPGRSRTVFAPLKPDEYTIIERAKHPSAGMTKEELLQAARTAARSVRQSLGAETRPARVTATVADDDNVPKLSKAQVDALHWIGAPKSTVGRERYGRSGESPTVVTVRVLERYGLALLSPYRLTDAGRAAYLAHEPTGRLSKPFNNAWRAAQAGVAFDNVAAAVEAACDRRELEIDEADEQECGTSESLTAPVKVNITIEAREGEDEVEFTRDEWSAMTPHERLHAIENAAIEAVNNAGGYGWAVVNPGDAAMVANERLELPSLEVLMMDIARYGEDCFKGERYRITDRLTAMRRTLEVLYREAGR